MDNTEFFGNATQRFSASIDKKHRSIIETALKLRKETPKQVKDKQHAANHSNAQQRRN